MFKNWGFLLGEIWVLLALAALVGLIAGWIIWGRRRKGGLTAAEASDLRTDLEDCKRARMASESDIARLKAELSNATAPAPFVAPTPEPIPSAEPEPEIVAADEPAFEPESEPLEDFDGDGIAEGAEEGTKPATLSEARDGQPDDLKLISGIGLKMEELCNSLGFYHFDQIASWTADEVAWVDANLEGFKGRVSRDDWVEQAKVLASGGTTDFANRVKDGDIY